MKLKSTNTVETNRVQLEIEVTNPQWSDAVSTAFNRKKKDITLPGFRKGKAPRAMIEKLYGDTFFYEDAINVLFGDVIEEAVSEANLEVVDKNNVDFDLVKAEKDILEFKVTVTTKPEVTIGEYKGLKAEKPSVEVTDADITAEIDAMRERGSRLVEVTDRAVIAGDTTVIDFSGSVDGVDFEGGTAKGHSLIIGSNSFIPGFEDQLINHKIGETFDVNVTFPEDYQAEELKGKNAVFVVTINEIKAKELPTLDDEFAKDVSEFDTLEALKVDISEKLLTKKQAESDASFENALIGQIVDGMTAEIPDVMIQARIDDALRDFAYRLQSQGLDLKTYMQFTGGDEAALRENFRPQAEAQVKTRLALEKIAKLEAFEIGDEDVDAELAKIAEMYKTEVANIKSAIPVEDVRGDLACTKAVDLVKSTGIEGKPAAKKAPAKKVEDNTEKSEKPAAKKTATKAAATKSATGTTAEKKPAAKKAPAKKAKTDESK